jgi:hypothetical protein
LTTALAKLGNYWNHPEQLPTTWRPTIVFVALTLLLASACLLLGPYPITKYPDDAFYFLTLGDLISQGHRPGIDYHSMHGPFPFLFAATAIESHGLSLEAIVLSQVMGAVVFGSLMFRIASRRVSGFWAVFLAISIELILVSCTPIGSKAWREFACAMWYNAIGYCIHSIVFFYLLIPERQSSRIQSIVDDVAIAFCFAALLITKASYFLPMAVVFGVGAILIPRPPLTRMRGFSILALGLLMAWGMVAAVGGSLMGSFDFIGSLAMKISPVTTCLRFIYYTRTIGLLLLASALAGWMAYEAKVSRAVLREVILAVLMFGTFLESAGTSAQDPEMLPMVGVVVLGLLTAIVIAAKATNLAVNNYLLAPALATALLLVVHEPKNGLLSLGFAHAPAATTIGPPVESFAWTESSALEGFLSPRVNRTMLTMMPNDWMSKIMDGIKMLQDAGVEKQDVVFVAAEVSPINMLTGSKYPAGYIAWWPTQFLDEAEESALIDQDLLSDVDYLLRETVDQHFWRFLTFHRGEYIKEHFRVVAETPEWVLYARKN